MFVAHYCGVADGALRDHLFDVYRRAYDRRPVEVTREVFSRAEFDETIARDTTQTWAVWDDDVVLAVLLVETRLERSPWISYEYLERQFPAQASSRKVAYVLAIAVDPDRASPFVARRCMAAGVEHFAREGMVMVFDVTDHLQDDDLAGGMAGAAQAITKRHDTPLELVGVTRYYVADFSRATA